MKGEMTTGHLVGLIVGTILLVILGFIIVNFVPGLAKRVDAMIGGFMNFQSPEEKTLLKAMSCAYYRCIEGCSSGKIKQAKWEDENGEKVSCLESFCKDEWRDDEGKICGDVAKENPVKVYLDGEVEIGEEHWKTIFTFQEPFITQQPCEPFGLSLGYATQALILPEELDCVYTKKPGFIVVNVKFISSCVLPEGDYNIWSGKGSGWDEEDIIICSAE